MEHVPFKFYHGGKKPKEQIRVGAFVCRDEPGEALKWQWPDSVKLICHQGLLTSHVRVATLNIWS